MILHRTCGEAIYSASDLRVEVLAVHSDIVKFAVFDPALTTNRGVLSRQMADVCRNKCCYFWFPQSGSCRLVVECAKGKSVLLPESACLTVIEVCANRITIAVTGQSAGEGLAPTHAPWSGGEAKHCRNVPLGRPNQSTSRAIHAGRLPGRRKINAVHAVLG